ncbi:MAG: DUF4012 domain-containing protein, partial [Actinomycetota bacterium]|nr:DUF4012 domain-containing protein [Actinomycetota bacterium]
ALVAWLANSWNATYQQARTVQSSATTLKSAAIAQQWDQLPTLFTTMRPQAQELAESTQSLPWRLLTMVPFVGASAGGVSDLAVSLNDVLTAAEPLLPYGQRFVTTGLRDADGRFDLSGLNRAAPDLVTLADVLEAAANRLEAIQTSQLLPQVSDGIVQMRDLTSQSWRSVRVLSELVTWGPSLIGADGKRTWLVLLQNPAEARGSGGFPGGFAVVTADDGLVKVASTGTSADLVNVPIPTKSASADSKALWGSRLKNWNTFSHSPNFPIVARLAADGMAARGTPVNGVIAIDPRVVAAILQVTGPVTANGETINAENAERFFTVDVYSQYRDPGKRDEVSMALVQAMITRLLSGGWDPVALVDALSGPVSQGHARVWSARPEEEAWLVEKNAGGDVPNAPGPVIALALNNSAASKMDAFMKTAVDYQPGSCDAAVMDSNLRVSLTNDSPTNLPFGLGIYDRSDDPKAAKGSTSTVLYVFAPLNARFNSVTIDGDPASLYLGREDGRDVWYVYLPIDRKQTRTIEIKFQQPVVDGVAPQVLMQSMVIDPTITIDPDTACS